MKTMIEVYTYNELKSRTWIALDEIEEIREHDSFCWILTGWRRFRYEGTIEHLAQATRSAADVRGEMRLIRMEGSHD